jgi:hypothetical protein
MASPDERQGDHAATTTCYVCNEISKGASAAAAADLALRPTESRPTASAKSASSRIATGVAEEAAPVAVLPDDAVDQSTIELGKR